MMRKDNATYAISRVAALFLGWALVLAPSWGALAGPWTPPQGQLYTKLSGKGSIPTGSYWSGAGRLVDDADGREFESMAFDLYIDYGLLDNLSIAIDSSLWRIQVSDAPTSDGNFSYLFPGHLIGISSRVALLDGPLALALYNKLSIPAGFEEDPEPHVYGDGRFEGDLALLWGFTWLEGWTSGHVGYKLIDEKPANQLGVGLDTGYRVASWFVPSVAVSYFKSIGTTKSDENPFDDQPERQDALTLTAGLGFPIAGGFGLQVFYQRVLWGLQVFDGNIVGASLSFKARIYEPGE
jgi:hypothetical protein